MRLRSSLVVALVAVAEVAAADDKTDCIRAFDNGQALRNAHELARAKDALLVCARPVCPAMLRKDCDDVLVQVDTATPSIVISATSAGHDVSAVRVRVDGVLVTSALDGRAVPVDPGEHTLRFEMNGAPPIEQQMLAREGEKNRSIAVSFEPQESRTNGATESHVAAPNQSLRWVGVTAAGAGVVALGIGIGFAVDARSKWSSAQQLCGAGCPMDPTSAPYVMRQGAYDSAAASTALFVAGGVVLAAGVTLFAVSLSSKKTSANVTIVPTVGGLAASGRF